jgi:hypothetical protein
MFCSIRHSVSNAPIGFFVSRCACVRTSVLAVLLLAALSATPARADEIKDPKFEYGKLDKPKDKPVEWKANAKLAFILSTGNSQAGSFSLGGSVSRKAHMNKFALDLGWTYARSRTLLAADNNGNGFIDEGEWHREDQTTNNAWFTKARYDRFLSEHNSLYAAGLIGGDSPSGKDLTGGGQAGYSRQLYASPHHEVVAELGYDFSYESYVDPKTSGLSIHSMRVFAGYALKFTPTSGLFANVETILNLNTEHVPTEDKTNEAGPFQDARVNGKAGLSATIWKRLSLSLSYAVKFDNVPAPKPAFKLPFAAGYVPLSLKVDTVAEAGLIYSFL